MVLKTKLKLGSLKQNVSRVSYRLKSRIPENNYQNTEVLILKGLIFEKFQMQTL